MLKVKCALGLCFMLFSCSMAKVVPPEPLYLHEIDLTKSVSVDVVDKECLIEPSQMAAIRFSFEYGRAYDLSYTLAAIAMKESMAGLWKINLQDPSGGLYHVTLDKAIRKLNIKDTNLNRNVAMQTLVDDDYFSAEIAVEEILFWKRKSGGNWNSVWAKYNAGSFGDKTTRGKLYAVDIARNIQKIKHCGWDSI